MDATVEFAVEPLRESVFEYRYLAPVYDDDDLAGGRPRAARQRPLKEELMSITIERTWLGERTPARPRARRRDHPAQPDRHRGGGHRMAAEPYLRAKRQGIGTWLDLY